ncbi:AAA family ATPase [Devriesea agamarum]|uniref:AAA family ATPase n=1 Tax=Devriesea agamarum TaxID=472569 RepID=UPI00071CB79F|nr:SMC family ATPase [Devriesea agamarum]
MKLLHLSLRGIGPFAGEHRIDLVSLSASGLFLLDGPTGSGKSTLIDAITYALFGQVAGAGASPQRIRSQFVDPIEPSWVDLVLETGAGIYRIRRYPEYERPKKRGGGTTKQQARAMLWRLTSPELLPVVIADTAGAGAGLEPISIRMDEIGLEMQRIIGLTREQFTQTVVLPQGEFARFLRAGTAQRQAVLQRVFGTEIYERIEQDLEERRRQARRDMQEAEAKLGAVIARFAEAAELSDDAAEHLAEQVKDQSAIHPATAGSQPQSPGLQSQPLGSQPQPPGSVGADLQTTQLDEVVGAAETRRDVAKAQAERARQELARASENREAVGGTWQAAQRRRDLDRLAQQIEQARDDHLARCARLADDTRAQPLARSLKSANQADHTAARAWNAVSTALDEAPDDLMAQLPDTWGRNGPLMTEGPRTAIRMLSEQPEHCDLVLGTLADCAAKASEQAGELRTLVELESALPARERAIAAVTAELTTTEATHTDVTERLAARPLVRTKLMRTLEHAQDNAQGLPDLRAAMEAAHHRAHQARQAAALEEDLRAARKLLAGRLRRADKALASEHDLRRRHLAGIAAQLALTLTPDQPCPVCGSQEHPAPAHPAPDAVQLDDVEAAEQKRRHIDDQVQSARADCERLHAMYTQASEAAGGMSGEVADAAHQESKMLHAKAQKAARAVEKLTTQVAAFDRDTATLEAEAATVRERAEQLRTRRTEAMAQFTRDAETIHRACDGYQRVADKRAFYEQIAAAARSIADLLRTAQQAVERAVQTRQEHCLARDGSGFTDDDAITAALMEPEVREAEERRVHEHDTACQRLVVGMEDEAVRQADASAENLRVLNQQRERAEAACHSAQEALTAADRAAGQAQATLMAVRRAREAVLRVLTETIAMRSCAGVILQVADLVTGNSSDADRIRLSTYVLMRRFDDVVGAANARLSVMSSSLLELVRDDGSRRRSHTGLDLKIIDHRTDTVRVPETLSGGETFIVSLCLALGLADIVTAEAGGVELQTLFIDEGFGSLDADTLETVIQEITRLADAGRAVGIVSHIPELKQRIAERVHVERTPSGHSTLTVFA